MLRTFDLFRLAPVGPLLQCGGVWSSAMGFCKDAYLPFSLGPHRAIFKILFLPDGHDLLQPVNSVTAGVKRRAAISRGNHDGDTGLADIKPPQPMDHTHAVDRKLLSDLLAYLPHLANGHRF